MEKVSKSSKLEFKDVMVSTKSKVLLKNVSGSASSGDLLAVMGPTGAGKTTFLNILAGRVSGDTGTITLNGSPLNKTQRRRLGYVSQDDIFLSNLTLWETLYFTAMIRIPDQVSQQEKTEKIYSVVDSLGLKKCLHTPIGDIFCRGISGGEKKRANIACELLTDPDILLIDEPTSGLDSSTAHTLMVQLKNYATEYNKTIVATIHQPSSQVFHMFSTLLLLVEGEVAYFGLANMVKEYFASLGMTCSQYYNPADFLMDILTKDTIRNMKEEDIRNIQSLQLPTGRLDGRSATESDKEGGTGPAGLPLTLVGSFPDASIHVTDDNYIVEGDTTRRWPTSFWTQFKMLNWRSYKQSKGRILHKFDLIQSAFIAAFVSRLFYQTEDSVNTVRDRMGLLMISLTYWSFQMLITTLLGFTGERAVVSKDRSAGAYRLSAYYLAKITSEMPLLLCVPLLFNTAVYWLAGLGGVDGYFVYIGIGILNCLMIQSLAHNLGVLIKDVRLSMMAGNVIIIDGLLLGGFLNINPPEWLLWVKYLTFTHYPYSAVMTYLLKDMTDVWCNQTSTDIFPQCLGNMNEALTSRDILIGIGVDLPIYCYIMTIVFAVLIFYVLGYYLLKWKRV
ncbi:ABC transporter G family member 14-like isoform X1 [Mizuhopecten yessoensis]|uniref:ABC transporter G family member 14-like isoform X1 n=1 Tax=Mizuhopecten yessoensis TaxID=6573 RepID=UPI000B458567|nr:ABC transporter G family member 14-like isoform X1 [Mizuhopecten yessoensis]XP_021349694.1 ABC transporter G family member 14-like isoform X1 [Mizuhopecten yessoensis]